MSDVDAAPDDPRCGVCDRPLAADETRTCLRCLSRARADLRDILTAYAQLPGALDQPATSRPDPAGPRTRGEPPMPGGDALVMLGPGSPGWAEDGETTRDDDPESVAYALTLWEDTLRRARGEPAAMTPTATRPADASHTTRTVHAAATYLQARAGWAAAHHPHFPLLARDLRALRTRLQAVTHTGDPADTGAPCLDCGTPLRQQWHDPRPCDDHPPGAHTQGCDQGGRSDWWACPTCRRRYDHDGHSLAVRATLEG